MKISKFLKEQVLLFVACFFLALAFLITKKVNRPAIFISKQDSTLNLNSKLTQHFHMGQKRLISSAMWIATILESDIEHYKQKDMNSWMYLRFKTISDLEPRFYENYSLGAVYLSIIKDDLLGASEIYERGLKEYPDDYYLLKNAAFHYEFEVGDQKRSFEIYSKLKKHPKIDFLTLGVASRMESEFGDKETAFKLLLSQYERLSDKNHPLALTIYNNLYALRAEIDLDCLNANQKNCASLDFENSPYIFNGKIYVAKKEWKPYRIKHREKKPN